jgi:hypothetical protein
MQLFVFDKYGRGRETDALKEIFFSPLADGAARAAAPWGI